MCQPMKLASVQSAGCIAEDEAFVYVGARPGESTYATTGLVEKVTKEGGNTVQLAAAPQFLVNITVDASEVYWTTGATVGRVAKEGGEVDVLSSGGWDDAAIALDKSRVYWADAFSGLVEALPLSGEGMSALLANGLSAEWMALDDHDIYLLGGALEGSGQVPYRVMKMGKDGSGLTTLMSSSVHAFAGVAVDDATVYVGVQRRPEPNETVSDKDDLIVALPKTGGPPVTLASGLASPVVAALDNENVYWMELGIGALRKVPKHGGATVTIVAHLNQPSGMVVDATSVYFTDAGKFFGDGSDGAVYKVAK
jgi:hypothetical protein